jgi:V8-like Glu-specific endopeptidase
VLRWRRVLRSRRVFRSRRVLRPRQVLVSLVLAAVAIPSQLIQPTAISDYPAARSFTGQPAVGALIPGTSSRSPHVCTASVVDSPGRDLGITAAHCLVGNGTGWLFVPGYHDGRAPYGTWHIAAIYVMPGWVTGQSPRDDVAFFTVAPQRRGGRTVNIQTVVGGDRLAIGRRYRLRTRVVGYPDGARRPIHCTNRTYDHDGYLGFDCNGYADGTSGGPFLIDVNPTTGRGWVDGVIGGLHQGGCHPYTSYSDHFTAAVARLYRVAVRGARGDVLPVAGFDGCL